MSYYRQSYDIHVQERQQICRQQAICSSDHLKYVIGIPLTLTLAENIRTKQRENSGPVRK